MSAHPPIAKITGPLDWSDDAACKGDNTDLFWPTLARQASRAQELKYLAQVNKAKKVCAGCKAKAKCLKFALENAERDGIWGGLSPEERRPLHRAHSLGQPSLEESA